MSSYDISLPDMEAEDRPLSSAALHILVALAESNLHGYGIMQAVKRQSGGQYKLGPGTLYANLDRLLASGWVGDSQRRTSAAPRDSTSSSSRGCRPHAVGQVG